MSKPEIIIITPEDVGLVDIDRLHPDPANAREDHDIDGIRASFREFGFRDPIEALPSGRIVAGHGRYYAAKEEGMVKVPVVWQKLDDLKATRYALANNRLAERSRWNPERLLSLHEAAGGDIPGFDDDFLEQLQVDLDEILDADGPSDPPKDPGAKMERLKELCQKWQPEPGQIWELPSTTVKGKAHRLMCGDSTSREMVTVLMQNERAVLFATDPPYLVDYDGTNHPHKWGEEDKNKDWSEAYTDWDKAENGEGLYEGFVALAVEIAITQDAAWYCWHASRRQAHLEAVWEAHGAFVHQQIIWAKDRPVLTRSWYMWQHEPCFFGWVRPNRPKRCSEDYPATVWNFPTIAPGQSTDHPTSKPVELFAIPMHQHTRKGELCYEPFCGSGSQMVAAEQTGRVCYAMEKCPEFVAVILERMAGMGLEPHLLGG